MMKFAFNPLVAFSLTQVLTQMICLVTRSALSVLDGTLLGSVGLLGMMKSVSLLASLKFVGSIVRTRWPRPQHYQDEIAMAFLSIVSWNSVKCV